MLHLCGMIRTSDFNSAQEGTGEMRFVRFIASVLLKVVCGILGFVIVLGAVCAGVWGFVHLPIRIFAPVMITLLVCVGIIPQTIFLVRSFVIFLRSEWRASRKTGG